MPPRRPDAAAKRHARNRAIIDLHDRQPELTLVQIGERFGLGESMICKILGQYREIHGRPFRLARRDRALLNGRLRVPRPTLKQLSDEFGLSESSVIRALKRAEKAKAIEDARHQAAAPRHTTPRVSPKPIPLATVGALLARPPSEWTVVVDRSPCPRCGVRGDIGCSHRSAS